MTTIFPLTAPSMPVPGLDFLRAAQAMGDTDTVAVTNKKGIVQSLEVAGHKLSQLTYDALYGQGNLCLKLTVKAEQSRPFTIVSGHRWGAGKAGNWKSRGPEPCDVMLVGKPLSENDAKECRFLSGDVGRELVQHLRKLGVNTFTEWYVTGVLKTEHLNEGSGAVKPKWIADQAFLLQQEVRLVKPKYILLLGSEAVKVFCGKNATLSGLTGQVIDLEFDMRKTADDTAAPLRCQAMACMHPSAIVHKPENAPQFLEALRRFVDLIQGGNACTSEDDLDYRVIETEQQLLDLCQEIDETTTNKIIAMDAEWHGDHPENSNAYLRTVQLSWAEKKAAVIKLRNPGGSLAFKRYVRVNGNIVMLKGRRPALTTSRGQERAMAILTEFMQDKRPCGHYFVADLEWLIPAGLDLRKQFAAPANWEDMPYKGGLDTALMAHALDETGDFSLTGQVLTYTTAPRYDAALNQWKGDYCRQNHIEKSQLEGYGDCPDEILIPYAAYDADVTYRLCMRHMKSLFKDEFGNNCWKPYWISQRAALSVLEITRTGLVLDREQATTLTERYMHMKNELEQKIRQWANWPTLKLRSTPSIQEFLFGRKYNGKDKVNGKRPRLRPKGAKSIATEPVLATGKPKRSWAEIVDLKKVEESAPCTDKMTLGILWHGSKNLKVWRKGEWVTRDLSKPIGWLRDHRFVSQVLQSTLRPPVMAVDEDGGGLVYQQDDDGNLVYDAGLPGVVCGDGRVRTTIYQTKETGRWSSARPPLQNISARREEDLARILGDMYLAPLRSVLTAPPGWCLVEADYVGAELFVVAILANDNQMMDHALRNQLSEADPNFYDIHSNVCVLAFGFECPPTKLGLKSIGKLYMRNVAKAVIFGLMYGRGARAIALGAQEEGIIISSEEAQRLIDTLFAMYPGLEPFFAACRWRAVGPRRDEIHKLAATDSYFTNGEAPRWIRSVFGRYRRFPRARSEKQKGEFERQAQNFPVQGAVADAVSLAAGNLYEYREQARAAGVTPDELDYRICLQVHDSLMTMAPAKHVPALVDTIMPKCMCEDIPIYPTHADGSPLGTGPYRFGIDTKVSRAWGVSMNPDDCLDIGLDPKYAGWSQYEDGYCKGGDTRRIWLPKRGFVSNAA